MKWERKKTQGAQVPHSADGMENWKILHINRQASTMRG